MNREELEKALGKIAGVKIVNVGDLCLNIYWFIDESMSEISVDTNLATIPVS